METTYFIILPQFNNTIESSEYMSTHSIEFAFSVNSDSYDSEGNQIPMPQNATIIPINGISMDIKSDLDLVGPGELHIKDGFIQYFKEIKL